MDVLSCDDCSDWQCSQTSGRLSAAFTDGGALIVQVNLKLFQTAPGKNKTVLLIVIRDRTRAPHAKMCADMRADLDTIWSALVKPPEHADSTVEDFFELQYVSLPSYEIEEDDFKAEATLLRRRFMPSYPESLVRADAEKVCLCTAIHFQ